MLTNPPKVTYPGPGPSARLNPPMSHSFAYLSQGQLHLKLGDEPIRPIDSRFGESIRHRAAQIQNRNAWKTQGTGAKFMSGGVLWGRGAEGDPLEMRMAITGISSGCNPGELFYSLSTDDIGGVFLLRDRANDELRLLHTADFRVRRLAAGPSQQSLACVIQRKGGQSCIAVMQADGTEMRDVTQGDTIDRSALGSRLRARTRLPIFRHRTQSSRIRRHAGAVRDSQA